MESKITVDVDDFIEGIEKWSDRKEFAKKLMLETLDLPDVLCAYKEDGATDKNILDEIDEDVIVGYLENKGYIIRLK